MGFLALKKDYHVQATPVLELEARAAKKGFVSLQNTVCSK